MSLTRQMLKALGIEGDAIEQIIEAHTETTDSLKAERDRLKKEAEKVAGLEEQLESVKAQLEKASDRSEYDALKGKYDDANKQLEKLQGTNKQLQQDYDAYKAEVGERETKRAKSKAYKELLTKAGVSQKYVGTVMKVADLSKIELEEDGGIKGADELVDSLKSEWKDFIPTKQTRGNKPDTPPEVDGGIKGANPRAVQIAKDRHRKLFGSNEE